jgi:hypothetical protein
MDKDYHTKILVTPIFNVGISPYTPQYVISIMELNMS